MAKSVKKAAKKAAPKTAKKAAPKPAAKAAKKAAPKKAAPKKAVKAAKKAAPKKAAAKKAAPKKAARKANPGLSAPLTVTPQMAEIVGGKPLPRTQIIKKIWDYIKANKLQDKTNKRMINADAKLAEILGGKKQVSMFELAKIVNNHVKK